MDKRDMKAKILTWSNLGLYSVSIELPHKAFNVDSNNYRTKAQAKRVAESLAARMNWNLIWE